MKSGKILAIISLITCVAVAGCSFFNKDKKQAAVQQAATYPGWTTVNLKDVGTMQIPPTLEVQTTDYLNKLAEVYKDNPDKMMQLRKDTTVALSFNNIICQPKGINDSGKEPAKEAKSAKVVFSIIKTQSKVPTYGQPIGLNQDKIKEFGQITKESIMSNNTFLGSDIQFLKWEPMKSEIINGAECLHIGYERQVGKEPVEQVDRYIFFDKDKLYTLELMYRTAEKDYWHGDKQDISNIINTLNIKPNAQAPSK